MNLYQFLKSLQEGIGDGCSVDIRLWEFEKTVGGICINIDWPNDFHLRVSISERVLMNDGFLEGYSEWFIPEAQRKFRIAEVGEE